MYALRLAPTSARAFRKATNNSGARRILGYPAFQAMATPAGGRMQSGPLTEKIKEVHQEVHLQAHRLSHSADQNCDEDVRIL